ncbi:MAG: hypothetical protein R3257_05535, partial [bacterium]|nr:hypothetical protein [bacterium]
MAVGVGGPQGSVLGGAHADRTRLAGAWNENLVWAVADGGNKGVPLAKMVAGSKYRKPLRNFPTVEAMPELKNLADLRPDQRWPIFQVALLNL